MAAQWIIWCGGDLRVLHAARKGSVQDMGVCGATGMVVGRVTLPSGTFTHCARCRAMLGE